MHQDIRYYIHMNVQFGAMGWSLLTDFKQTTCFGGKIPQITTDFPLLKGKVYLANKFLNPELLLSYLK